MPATPPASQQPSPSRAQQKRAVIRAAAHDLFVRDGYVGTSMDDVAAQAGVSKQTVYKHFSDKAALFETIVLDRIDASDAETRDLLAALPDREDFEDGLREFARLHVRGVLDPAVVALRRTVIGEAGRFPQLARTWWEHGPRSAHRTLAEVFARAAAAGRLGPLDDPLLAAQHFNWLVLSIPLNDAMLLGVEATLADADLEAVADEGVRVFLAAYGPR